MSAEKAGVVVMTPEPPDSDESLATRAQGGDRWAEEALLRRHTPALYGLLTRLLRDPIEAEDALQDTLVHAIRDLSRLSDPSAVGAWLRRIAVHRAHRRFRRRRWLPVDPEGLAALASADASPEVRTELALIDRALRRLSADLQTAWLLRHVEGHTLEEAAELCGIALATVKRRLAKADRIVTAFLQRGGG